MSQKEIPKEVEENLYPGEQISYSLKKKFRLEAKPKYLIVTDRRVMYLDQKILGRYDLSDIPYEKLEQVSFHKGPVASEFVLKSEEGRIINLTWMEREEATSALNAIQDSLNAIAVEPVSIRKKKGLLGEDLLLKKPPELVSRTIPMTRVVEERKAKAEEGPADKLKKLKELYDAGVINEQEYGEKRKKLLELL
ncbi:MAG: PH domain-containing protein [Methanophagales archaeon]|nr:PH domain-containing protein [Methanophagales archaeon]